MNTLLDSLLLSDAFVLIARVVLTFVFWSAGLMGIFAFKAKIAEIRAVGLPQPELFAVAVTIVQLGGSGLIIANIMPWLGAGALAGFLLLTTPIAHPFWKLPEPQRTFKFFLALEHLSLIGGLMVAAALGAFTGQ